MNSGAGVANGRILVAVYSADPLTALGVSASLEGCARIEPMSTGRRLGLADVVVLTAESITATFLNTVRTIVEAGASGLVIVLDDQNAVDQLSGEDLNVLSKTSVDADSLRQAILRADRTAGRALLDRLGRVGAELINRRRGRHGLDSREVDVLRLLSAGHTVREIADMLNYSERTVKNVLGGLISRLHLRNRTQAVAYALRVKAF